MSPVHFPNDVCSTQTIDLLDQRIFEPPVVARYNRFEAVDVQLSVTSLPWSLGLTLNFDDGDHRNLR